MVEGKFGIKATVLADSISEAGIRFTTFEIEYPRLILSELNTHRMLSKNSASSRAIPFKKMLDQLTARPVRFGQANPGMQDKGEEYREFVSGEKLGDSGFVQLLFPEDAWKRAKEDSVKWAQRMFDAGYHKQVYNRLVEPFQMMKTVISGTEWNNFFWLRDDVAADPTIAELARCMKQARDGCIPMCLRPGEWHLPYVDVFISETDNETLYYYIEDDEGNIEMLDIKDAIKVSCARCAAVSFRNTDYGVEKSREVYGRLVGDERKHASAFEHCATPMAKTEMEYADFVDWQWEDGVSHMDNCGHLWSGNLRGWVQYRKLIVGENYPG